MRPLFSFPREVISPLEEKHICNNQQGTPNSPAQGSGYGPHANLLTHIHHTQNAVYHPVVAVVKVRENKRSSAACQCPQRS